MSSGFKKSVDSSNEQSKKSVFMRLGLTAQAFPNETSEKRESDNKLKSAIITAIPSEIKIDQDKKLYSIEDKIVTKQLSNKRKVTAYDEEEELLSSKREEKQKKSEAFVNLKSNTTEIKSLAQSRIDKNLIGPSTSGMISKDPHKRIVINFENEKKIIRPQPSVLKGSSKNSNITNKKEVSLANKEGITKEKISTKIRTDLGKESLEINNAGLKSKSSQQQKFQNSFKTLNVISKLQLSGPEKLTRTIIVNPSNDIFPKSSYVPHESVSKMNLVSSVNKDIKVNNNIDSNDKVYVTESKESILKSIKEKKLMDEPKSNNEKTDAKKRLESKSHKSETTKKSKETGHKKREVSNSGSRSSRSSSSYVSKSSRFRSSSERRYSKEKNEHKSVSVKTKITKETRRSSVSKSNDKKRKESEKKKNKDKQDDRERSESKGKKKDNNKKEKQEKYSKERHKKHTSLKNDYERKHSKKDISSDHKDRKASKSPIDNDNKSKNIDYSDNLNKKIVESSISKIRETNILHPQISTRIYSPLPEIDDPFTEIIAKEKNLKKAKHKDESFSKKDYKTDKKICLNKDDKKLVEYEKKIYDEPIKKKYENQDKNDKNYNFDKTSKYDDSVKNKNSSERTKDCNTSAGNEAKVIENKVKVDNNRKDVSSEGRQYVSSRDQWVENEENSRISKNRNDDTSHQKKNLDLVNDLQHLRNKRKADDDLSYSPSRKKQRDDSKDSFSQKEEGHNKMDSEKRRKNKLDYESKDSHRDRNISPMQEPEVWKHNLSKESSGKKFEKIGSTKEITHPRDDSLRRVAQLFTKEPNISSRHNSPRLSWDRIKDKRSQELESSRKHESDHRITRNSEEKKNESLRSVDREKVGRCNSSQRSLAKREDRLFEKRTVHEDFDVNTSQYGKRRSAEWEDMPRRVDIFSKVINNSHRTNNFIGEIRKIHDSYNADWHHNRPGFDILEDFGRNRKDKLLPPPPRIRRLSDNNSTIPESVLNSGHNQISNIKVINSSVTSIKEISNISNIKVINSNQSASKKMAENNEKNKIISDDSSGIKEISTAPIDGEKEVEEKLKIDKPFIYEEISDDDIDDIIEDALLKGDESLNNQIPIVDMLDIKWDVLMTASRPIVKKSFSNINKLEKENNDKIRVANIINQIGISKEFAGDVLYGKILEMCQGKNEVKNIKNMKIEQNESSVESKALNNNFEFHDEIANFHASTYCKLKQQFEIIYNIGPHRRALCARRDLAIRRNLCHLDKEEANLIPTQIVDQDLFKLSLQLFQQIKLLETKNPILEMKTLIAA